MPRIASLLVLALVLSVSPATLRSAQVWDNGTPTPDLPTLDLSYFLPADNFTLTSSVFTTGFTYWGSAMGSSPGFFSTYWQLYADAGGVPGATPLASGSSTASAYYGLLGGWDFYQHDVSWGSLSLGPGTYWLALHNGPLEYRGYYYAALHSYPGGARAEMELAGGSWTALSGQGEIAFQIHGEVVPEPSAFLLLGTGLVGLCLMTLRRREKNPG